VISSTDGVPLYDVAITHYRDPAALIACLKSLDDHEGIASITVADGQSDGSLRRLASETSDLRLLEFSENVGFGSLANAAMSAGSAPYVLLLNADTAVPPETPRRLISELTAMRDVGVVGPRLCGRSGHQPSAFRFYRPQTLLFRRTALGATRFGAAHLRRFMYQDELTDSLEGGGSMDVDWLMGAALMIRRAGWSDVGGFDEKYWMYFEDVDWCRRFWNHGWRVRYVPSVSVFHTHGQGSRPEISLVRAALTSRLFRAHLRSAVRYFRKFGLGRTRGYGARRKMHVFLEPK
jgi:N-acetylglucosaminyl-diphospho-decaprenol L-rhamnosyltransferase